MKSEPDAIKAGKSGDAAEGGISRREFFVRAGATGALLAGAAAGGYALWQPKHFVPGLPAGKGVAASELCHRAGQNPAVARHRAWHGTRHNRPRRHRRARRHVALHQKGRRGHDQTERRVRHPARARGDDPSGNVARRGEARARSRRRQGVSSPTTRSTAPPVVFSRAACARWPTI